ncbi:MAG: CRISPR-associated protein [Candidatus Nitrosocaldaceae archaeon]|nr:MAG: CRISPR-associated protein [Candidatus Nitrosocaldaceae archaeon]
MNEFHAIICGTSLLSNFTNRNRAEADRLGITDWYRLEPDDPRQIDAEKCAYKGNPIFDKLYKFLEEDPKKASAELNSFLRFCELYHAEREALLYCTDTGTGWLSAYVIYNYLKNNNIKMISEPKKLRYFKSSETFEDGLIDIIDNMSRIIINKKRQGFKVHINATGGFKPESTFAVIGAFIAGADSVYYRFETFRDLIKLPAIPLRLDIDRYKRIIDELDTDKSIDSLIDKGFDKAYLDELDAIGIIKIDGVRVKLREWVKKLISMSKE